MKTILIENKISCHYEIIESIILKYNILFKINKEIPVKIYLNINKNDSFKKYINDKYPNIKFKKPNNYDYYINCTFVPKTDFNIIKNKNSSNHIWISHTITDNRKKINNIYYITPLSKKNYIYADILPYSDKKIKTDIPIYIVQGSVNRRKISDLIKILDVDYKYKFKIKILNKYNLPDSLLPYKDKIIYKQGLDFINYHKEFSDVYCILTLLSKTINNKYYKKQLTSTINYARGYKLKCLIDKDLQDIYKLKNVEIYNNTNDIQSAFKNTLELFYHKLK
jgi:hypothetical protein